MSISANLFQAILAMDSYNRGYNAGISGLGGAGTSIGSAVVSSNSGILGTDVDVAASFFAQAYTLADGTTVISYRGTDDYSLLNSSSDVWTGWVTGVGTYGSSQAKLAAQFYQQINGGTGPNANLVLTGHSLGGGLAGFIGSIYGTKAVMFDNMPFELAASRLYDAAVLRPRVDSVTGEYLGNFADDGSARDLFYNGADPSVPTTTGFQSFAVLGEILSDARGAVGQQTLTSYLNPSISSSEFSRFFELHSQALLVTTMWASENNRSDWRSIAAPLFRALFDDELAKEIGLIKGTTGSADPANQMFGRIAYTALYDPSPADGWTYVFGSTGIRALFNDADELGRLASAGETAAYLKDRGVQKALSDIAVEYAGLLARNKDTAESGDQDLTGHEKGALYYDQVANRLIGNFTPEMWKSRDGETIGNPVDIVGKKTLTDAVSEFSGTNKSTVKAAVGRVWGGSTENVVKLVAATRDESVTLNATTDGGIPAEEPVDGRGAMLVGAGGAEDRLIGAQGRDLLLGGAGKDILIGGRGDDLLFGGKGEDTFKGYDPAAPATAAPAADAQASGHEGNDWIDGGDDKDTVDYAKATTSIAITLGAENGKVDGGNVVKVTDDGTGGTDTLVSIEKVVLGSAKDTVTVEPFEGATYYPATSYVNRPVTLFDMGGEPEAAQTNLRSGDTVDFSQYGRAVYLSQARRAGEAGVFELYWDDHFAKGTGLQFKNVEFIVGSSQNARQGSATFPERAP